MGMKEDLKKFDDETNPDGRDKFTKKSLYSAVQLVHPDSGSRPKRKSSFLLEDNERKWFIENEIVKYARKEDIDSTKDLINDLAKKYEGAEIFALDFLSKGAKAKYARGKLLDGGRLFDRYIDVLDILYEDFLKFVPPWERDSKPYSGEIEKFFIRCHAALGDSDPPNLSGYNK